MNEPQDRQQYEQPATLVRLKEVTRRKLDWLEGFVSHTGNDKACRMVRALMSDIDYFVKSQETRNEP